MRLFKPILDPRVRRNRFHIMAEILNASKDGLTKTQIMYRANLSFAQLVNYVSLLCELNLLETIKVDEKTIYKTTRKGKQFLQRFKEIKHLLKKLYEKQENRSKKAIVD